METDIARIYMTLNTDTDTCIHKQSHTHAHILIQAQRLNDTDIVQCLWSGQRRAAMLFLGAARLRAIPSVCHWWIQANCVWREAGTEIKKETKVTCDTLPSDVAFLFSAFLSFFFLFFCLFLVFTTSLSLSLSIFLPPFVYILPFDKI